MEAIAARWGVQERYQDWEGRWRTPPPASVRAVLEAMGAGARRPLPGATVIEQGRRLALGHAAELTLESGETRRVEGEIAAALPLGYHRLTDSRSGRSRRLIVVPAACAPAPFGWGWALQLYALRSQRSWGIGDLRDLKEVAAWSAAGLGARILMVNPLHAPLPGTPQQPSPYYPSSRRFRNPIFLDVDEVAGRPPAQGARGRALNRERRIDRDSVYRLKMASLEHVFAGFEGDPEFDRYRAEQGAGLEAFATFCALTEELRTPWTEWPEGVRRPDGAGIDPFRRSKRRQVDFHAWLQWHCDRQLGAAAGEIALIQDLAVGVDPAGADAWTWQDVYAPDFRVGAPPDEFNRAGQDWGLPPFDPWRLRAAGYEPFISTVRAMLRHSGGLRIDHVMGLFRLFWVPLGATPDEGVYVRYPARDLLGILALESVRAGAFVVGEDLGTVEPSVRAQLKRRGVLSYRLLWFEKRPPERYPEAALAAVTTHDLPTIAGLWTGSDLEEQRGLGLPANEESMHEIARRLARLAGVGSGAPVSEVVAGTYAALARAPSRLLSGTLDDALEVRERPNLPGTLDERPNWSLALPEPLERIMADPRVRRIAAILGSRGPATS